MTVKELIEKLSKIENPESVMVLKISEIGYGEHDIEDLKIEDGVKYGNGTVFTSWYYKEFVESIHGHRETENVKVLTF